MSFFGFDTNLPGDRRGGQGMFDRQDPFGGLGDGGDQEALDFDQTYDGLGQHLQETGDEDNDDTFGGDMPVTRDQLGKDFDFAGQTANIRDTLLEEQVLHQARQPMQQARAPKPARTGYEAYKQPDYMPKLEADASIWGTSVTKKQAPQVQQEQPLAGSAPKMMSLEEVEAMMRANARPTPLAQQPAPDVHAQTLGLKNMLGLGGPPSGAPTPPAQQPQPAFEQQQQRPPQILQRPQPPQENQQPQPDYNLRAPQILQRQHSPANARPQSQDFNGQPQFQHGPPPGMPRVGGHTVPPHVRHQQQNHQQHGHNRGPSYSGPPITQAQQLMQMAPEEREAYLAEEAKRAKRNHKIFLLSKNNGLMTPQDKNFITRIQLQQLLTATGGIDNEQGSEEQLAEDFYYQVYASIRGPPRSGPGQPLNQFAQTYLFQTGSRYGYGRSRHHPRGGDNHVQRMEQQVARAVEAAKARPKNKQLVMEGSLGKIAFSNSKTPRPLLNIKRPDSAHPQMRPPKPADRKTALRNIESLYSTLMRLEDHERKLPPPPNEDSPPDVIEDHMRWRSEMQELNQQLWETLKVMEPIQPNPTTPHPFIQLLSHSKGKKAIPRIFRHLDDNQRLTMLTLIAIHLDILDVIRDAYPPADNSPVPPRVKEEVFTFEQAVLPPLYSYISEAPLNIIIGLVGLVLDRVHLQAIVRTKIGVLILTAFINRAELVTQQQGPSDDWSSHYGRLFDTIEPVLPYMFPTETNLAASDDVHIWHFLATVGVGASPDQQQRLVLGVKDRVMETVAVSKTLPEEMSQKRLGDVNLFMRAIGLDVELLG
ncbi:DNA topoisomerase 2-associated protein pat1 [Fulvia fulva]|uniref:DNA topoisomerase 2-associated protein pat1 n=1 Tax=Passalora fulva TaxID=5499 RepID=A0A9Q8UT43_PASFU|nr:DNA topoisomerase 2-associated protein pat1 [Fulvia fulva]KAK4617821.1 DNA topoisomerase 2-associated protein pat1 [Fulvia fulva]KAK4619224.1 DNA topoisomerase 2-associated protein pat1 [Fulvia fulva]UJO21400.1 DNA topoisomerase 2-associated protein pat1 [Fulvia fulva]WPV18626.1 DNA topoisomerase 2-associated protein pat1 [Fulvia fulva]WPV33516.1 DNA topoisomerase 2-associated protein pat1 [Fulvia fulva]